MTNTCSLPGWKDKKSHFQSIHHCYCWAALELVRRKSILSVFTNNASEQQHMYMSFFLKCTDRMSICMFITRTEQLNPHLPLLPCLKDSDQAIVATARMNVSFSENQLAIIILRCMLRIYDDQYWLTKNFIPIAPPSLCVKLELLAVLLPEPSNAHARANPQLKVDKTISSVLLRPLTIYLTRTMGARLQFRIPTIEKRRITKNFLFDSFDKAAQTKDDRNKQKSPSRFVFHTMKASKQS